MWKDQQSDDQPSRYESQTSLDSVEVRMCVHIQSVVQQEIFVHIKMLNYASNHKVKNFVETTYLINLFSNSYYSVFFVASL